MKRIGLFKRFYTLESLFQLFMVCAFPLHAWSLLMAFRDFAWVSLRTSMWDAIGLVSYAMLFALVETTGVFLFVLLIGLLVPATWAIDKRTALIGTLFWVVAFWSILAQLYSLFGFPLPERLFRFLIQSAHPFRIIWGTVFGLVTVSVVVLTYLIVKFENAKNLIISVIDRITIVSSFYVFLDFIGIVIIVIRNLN